MLEQHPVVAEAVVVSALDDIKGEIPVAFIVRCEGSELTYDDLKRDALAHGSAYAHPTHRRLSPSIACGRHALDRSIYAEGRGDPSRT
jgi:long-chain acyl-CoA synthetase